MRNKSLKYFLITVMLLAVLPAIKGAVPDSRRITLPNREQLSSNKVLHVMQDEEGFLWYATDGGGICRDDGRQVEVFRSNAECPDLLGSNNVICLAEAEGKIVIGTSHGANVLDKRDYSISRLKEVDDKRVDDIIVTVNGHWWLTSNKKVYEYSADGKWLKTYDAGDKYIFRLHQDKEGRLWCQEWEGGMLRLDNGRFVQISKAWSDNISFSRISTDRQGRQLVADGLGECYALSSDESESWFKGTILTRYQADSIRVKWKLSARPTALAISKQGDCWFSTGKDIRCMGLNGKETVISQTKDVSAMDFTPDGTLWLATVYGQLSRYVKGKVVADEYGSNEYGDGIMAMSVDSMGRLVLVSDRYIRLYDIKRQTLRQQSREADGVYVIELQETNPNRRWSQPNREIVVERVPRWLKSWWMCCVYVLVIAGVFLLLANNVILRRQRRRFLVQIKEMIASGEESTPDSTTGNIPVKTVDDEWLKKAIAQIESHLSEEGYTVEQLSADMCMSRMTFYRRIQTLTGQSPTEFVRTIRLHRAAELLREGQLNITEISYATGFSSVSYFSRCFRKMFGVPPTQFF